MYTVCIATTAESSKHKSLRLTIKSICAQSMPPDEVIVAINRPRNEGLFQEMMLQSAHVKVIFADAKIGNVSHARNIAARSCKSEFIAFIDDDSLAGGIDVMKNLLSHSSSFDFSCGARRLWAPLNWEDSVSESNQITYNIDLLKHISIEPININRNNGKQKLSNYSFIGNFGLVRTRLFEEIGGFDENFTGWGYEDTDLMQELFHSNARYLNMRNVGASCIHLTHPIDKSNVASNINLYNEKIKKRGRQFSINHHFGLFENDGFESFF